SEGCLLAMDCLPTDPPLVSPPHTHKLGDTGAPHAPILTPHVTESCLMTDHDLRPALAILLLALTCQASDWPQFRGPHRDNVSKDTSLLQSWPKDGPALAWKAQGLGSGYSSASQVTASIPWAIRASCRTSLP